MNLFDIYVIGISAMVGTCMMFLYQYIVNAYPYMDLLIGLMCGIYTMVIVLTIEQQNVSNENLAKFRRRT